MRDSHSSPRTRRIIQPEKSMNTRLWVFSVSVLSPLNSNLRITLCPHIRLSALWFCVYVEITDRVSNTFILDQDRSWEHSVFTPVQMPACRDSLWHSRIVRGCTGGERRCVCCYIHLVTVITSHAETIDTNHRHEKDTKILFSQQC